MRGDTLVVVAIVVGALGFLARRAWGAVVAARRRREIGPGGGCDHCGH